MPFTMSGADDAWSYNRFDEYDKALNAQLKAKEEETAEEEVIEEGSCGAPTQGYQKGGEVKAKKEECKKCEGKGCKHCDGKGTHEPRWQDSDGDGKWYEKGEDVKEGKEPLHYGRMLAQASNKDAQAALEKDKAKADKMIDQARVIRTAVDSDLLSKRKSKVNAKPHQTVKKEEVELEEGKSDRPLGIMHPFARGMKQKKGEKREEKYGSDSEGNRAGKYIKREEVEFTAEELDEITSLFTEEELDKIATLFDEETGQEMMHRLIAGHKQKKEPKAGTKAHAKHMDEVESNRKRAAADDKKIAAKYRSKSMKEAYAEVHEAAKDQSDKQLEKGMKTTYKAQGELANADYGKYKDGKEERMTDRLKARRKDIMDTQHDRNMKKLQDLQRLVDQKKVKKEEVEIEEGLKHREADTGKVVDKAEVGKTYYTDGPRKKSSVAKAKELKKEELEATGLFTAEEIEALLERNEKVEAEGQKVAALEREGRAKGITDKFRKEHPGSREAKKVPGAKPSEGELNQARIRKANERIAKHGLTAKEKGESAARAKYDSARD
ncbi:hypothetical protein [Synechococcus phage S-B68]|nr:hypothetical protein [Synechococcus phage S-B68]